jgi:hypothetical protein
MNCRLGRKMNSNQLDDKELINLIKERLFKELIVLQQTELRLRDAVSESPLHGKQNKNRAFRWIKTIKKLTWWLRHE